MSGPEIDNSRMEEASASMGQFRFLPLGDNDAMRPSLPADFTLLSVLEQSDGSRVAAYAMRCGAAAIHVEFEAHVLRILAANFLRAADSLDNGKGKQ